MDERFAPSPTAAGQIVNMHRSAEGLWKTCGGFGPAIAASGFSQLGPIHSLHWFAQHQGGRQWLVFEHESGNNLILAYLNFPADQVTTIQSGRRLVRGPWIGTSYLESGDWIVALNGYDTPIRWNGKELVEFGFSALPPPPTVRFAGFDAADATFTIPAGGLDNFAGPFQRGVGEAQEPYAYGYATTWVNDRGMESPPSAITWIRGDNPDGTVNLIEGLGSNFVHMPAAPAHVRGQRLYRTQNVRDVSTSGQQGHALYLVEEFATGGEVAFVDDAPDSELGLLLNQDLLGLMPPGARFAQVFKDTLFTDGGASAQSRLRYSAPRLVEQMPEVNYLLCGDATTGQIVALKSTKNALLVFKRRGIYLLKGDPRVGFFTETLTEDLGCAASRSVIELPGIGTLFLSDDGPYVLEGALENTGTPTALRFIGQNIAETWLTRINKKALAAARAERFLREREVWLQIPVGGDDRASLGLVLHYDAAAWSLREGFPFSCLAEARDHRGHLFGGSWDSAHRGVHVVTRGSSDLDGDPLQATFGSSWVMLGKREVWREVTLHVLDLHAAITVEWHVDREPLDWNPGPADRLADDYETTRDRWGSARWGSARWWPQIPTWVRCSLHNARGFDLQWRALGADLELLGADLTLVSQGDIKPRTDRIG